MNKKPYIGFEVEAEEVEYANKYMEVTRYDLKRPSGITAPYWVMRRGDFSVIIPLYEDLTTVMIGQYRVGADFYSWEFPMGSVTGLAPLEMAKQELEEEAGLQANKWELLGEYYPLPSWNTQLISIFLAQDFLDVPRSPEETESLEVKHMQLSEVKKMINNGTIKDGPTITAYYYLERYLNK